MSRPDVGAAAGADRLVRRSATAARILASLSDAIEDGPAAERSARDVKVPVALADVLELLGGYLGGDRAVAPPPEAPAPVPVGAPTPERRLGVEPKLGTRFAREASEADGE